MMNWSKYHKISDINKRIYTFLIDNSIDDNKILARELVKYHKKGLEPDKYSKWILDNLIPVNKIER